MTSPADPLSGTIFMLKAGRPPQHLLRGVELQIDGGKDGQVYIFDAALNATLGNSRLHEM